MKTQTQNKKRRKRLNKKFKHSAQNTSTLSLELTIRGGGGRRVGRRVLMFLSPSFFFFRFLNILLFVFGIKCHDVFGCGGGCGGDRNSAFECSTGPSRVVGI